MFASKQRLRCALGLVLGSFATALPGDRTTVALLGLGGEPNGLLQHERAEPSFKGRHFALQSPVICNAALQDVAG
jgi:hypothetical protein